MFFDIMKSLNNIVILYFIDFDRGVKEGVFRFDAVFCYYYDVVFGFYVLWLGCFRFLLY